MSPTTISAIVRHVLTAAGAGAATKYGIDGEVINAIIGGAAALAGLAWSLAEKRVRA